MPQRPSERRKNSDCLPSQVSMKQRAMQSGTIIRRSRLRITRSSLNGIVTGLRNRRVGSLHESTPTIVQTWSAIAGVDETKSDANNADDRSNVATAPVEASLPEEVSASRATHTHDGDADLAFEGVQNEVLPEGEASLEERLSEKTVGGIEDDEAGSIDLSGETVDEGDIPAFDELDEPFDSDAETADEGVREMQEHVAGEDGELEDASTSSAQEDEKTDELMAEQEIAPRVENEIKDEMDGEEEDEASEATDKDQHSNGSTNPHRDGSSDVKRIEEEVSGSSKGNVGEEEDSRTFDEDRSAAGGLLTSFACVLLLCNSLIVAYV
eukprot:TRINITY_DN1550_c0_g1_i3.p1 TRINITY_DN1550_c0_g1~~TRINITY_DN1550_c0_g1_i3.p1  ORF type:complete len:325 (+),score=79.44 TRINITY_DN1550_c0_g1_i3:31-1005(+)